MLSLDRFLLYKSHAMLASRGVVVGCYLWMGSCCTSLMLCWHQEVWWLDVISGWVPVVQVSSYAGIKRCGGWMLSLDGFLLYKSHAMLASRGVVVGCYLWMGSCCTSLMLCWHQEVWWLDVISGWVPVVQVSCYAGIKRCGGWMLSLDGFLFCKSHAMLASRGVVVGCYLWMGSCCTSLMLCWHQEVWWLDVISGWVPVVQVSCYAGIKRCGGWMLSLDGFLLYKSHAMLASRGVVVGCYLWMGSCCTSLMLCWHQEVWWLDVISGWVPVVQVSCYAGIKRCGGWMLSLDGFLLYKSHAMLASRGVVVGCYLWMGSCCTSLMLCWHQEVWWLDVISGWVPVVQVSCYAGIKRCGGWMLSLGGFLLYKSHAMLASRGVVVGCYLWMGSCCTSLMLCWHQEVWWLDVISGWVPVVQVSCYAGIKRWVVGCYLWMGSCCTSLMLCWHQEVWWLDVISGWVPVVQVSCYAGIKRCGCWMLSLDGFLLHKSHAMLASRGVVVGCYLRMGSCFGRPEPYAVPGYITCLVVRKFIGRAMVAL